MTDGRSSRGPLEKPSRLGRSVVALLAMVSLLAARSAGAQDAPPLPSPLDTITVARLAREGRDEVAAARARAVAAGERPKIVSALPDPMVMMEARHIPFRLQGVSGSVTLQQEFPLSGVLGDRRRAAEAEAERWSADTRRITIDVEFEALEAFFLLAQRRGTVPILEEQIALTDQLTMIARAHLATGQGTMVDALRLENETARYRAERRALDPEIHAAEAILDAALAREPAAPIPELAWNDDLRDPPPLDALVRQAVARRPELALANASRRRALAEVEVMRSMYTGYGVMGMVGISLPIWREKLGAGVGEAQAMATGASAEISALARVIAGNVASAREHVFAERTRLVSLRDDILPRSRQVVASATASFGAGQGSMLAVLDATRDLRDVRMQELMARERLSVAWAKLRREKGD